MKIKHIILICSVLTLFVTNAFMTNFFKAPKYVNWKQLTWDDFQGLKLPFTRFSAGIATNLALEFDSTRNKYHSYAYNNVTSSWKSSDSDTNYALLKHEQYHFNITEAHARMLNDYIDRGHSKWEIKNVHLEINSMKNAMQAKYDKETDHSLIQSMQKRWEYKIDSMLLHYDSLNSYHEDSYSNYRIFFPNKISSKYIGNREGQYMPERSIQFNYYDMYFVSRSYYIGWNVTGKLFFKFVNQFAKDKELEVHHIEFDTLSSSFEAKIKLFDSTKEEHLVIDLTYNRGYLYEREVIFPHEEDITGYIENANSFLNSFELRSAIRVLTNQCGESVGSQTIEKLEKYDEEESSGCMIFKNYGNHIYFAKPIILDTGYYLYFDPMTHPDSLILESFLIYDDTVYYATDDCKEKIFYVEDLPLKDSLFIEIGYTLKEDTLKHCLEAYFQEILLYEFDL